MALRWSGVAFAGTSLQLTPCKEGGGTLVVDPTGGTSSPSMSPPANSPEMPPAPASHTLVLKNLNREMSTQQLEDYLHSLPVTPVWVDRNAASGGKAAAVAFVRYRNIDAAMAAMAMLPGTVLHGRPVKAEYKRTKDRTRSRGGSEDFGGSVGSPAGTEGSGRHPVGSAPISIHSGASHRRRSRGLSMGHAPSGSYGSSLGSDDGGLSASWRERRAASKLAAALASGALPPGTTELPLSSSMGSTGLAGTPVAYAKGPTEGSRGFQLSRTPNDESPLAASAAAGEPLPQSSTEALKTPTASKETSTTGASTTEASTEAGKAAADAGAQEAAPAAAASTAAPGPAVAEAPPTPPPA